MNYREDFYNTALSAEERAKLIVSEMTAEEKASILLHNSAAIERLGIPEYNWWGEGLHGVARAGTATMFPQAIALGALFDEELIYEVARVISKETRAKYNSYSKHNDRDIYKGLTLWSPNINIFRDPRWGRGHETFGECPYLTARTGVAFVKGIQGDGDVMEAAACAKHYAVHSGPEAIRHEFDAVSNVKDMEETYLPAFKALVTEAKVEGVMGAYNRVNGDGACASDYLMRKLDEWNFDGYFVSDYLAIRDFHEHHGLTKTPAESAALALKKGCNINAGNTYAYLMDAYNDGLINDDDLTKSAIVSMRTRIRLGTFDKETQFDNLDLPDVSTKEHKMLSLKAAEKSMVLLKNDGILPLKKSELKSIGVIGPNADSRDALIGNYFGTADRYHTFLEGIEDEVGNDVRVYYSLGAHLYKKGTSGLAFPDDRIAEAVAVAEISDVVILCLGLDANLEGEEGDTGNEFSSGDKNDLRIPKSQQILLENVMKVGKPVVVVLASGSSLNIENDKINALIEAWYPGSEGGTALANILFGKVSPSGKLPVTFYETADKLPDFTDYSMKNRTYRYAENNVLYPFGYGLTYSKVIASDLKYSDKTATVTLKNIGNTDTDEVCQLYIKDNKSKFAVRNYNLCGFKRVFIKALETVEVSLKLTDEMFEIVDDNGKRYIDSDSFTLFAGVNAPDELSEKLTGEKCQSLNIKF